MAIKRFDFERARAMAARAALVRTDGPSRIDQDAGDVPRRKALLTIFGRSDG